MYFNFTGYDLDFKEKYRLLEGAFMKDYSLDSEDSKTFVLNYIVKDNQIIVHFADKKNYVIPYTIENEAKLLNKMKTQVLQSNQFIEQQEERFSKLRAITAMLFGTTLPLVSTFASGISIISGIVVVLSVLCIGCNICNMIDIKRNIKDINKNKLLLNNEERLNEKVKKNPNVLANSKGKVKKMVHSTPVDQPVFTLNSIDKIRYEELRQILENIDREEEFGFDYSSEVEKKTLILKKKIK